MHSLKRNSDQMNLVLIILDTLRQDHIGAYGNEWIITPNLDTLAAESVVFTRCYPESLPTLPVRRALHTGSRTFPFVGHRDFKGDFLGAPGWGPIPEEQDTVAEILGDRGYRTAFITDTYHHFKPSKNFHRGFQEWIWIRGQEGDRYRTGLTVPAEDVASHIPARLKDQARTERFVQKYLCNSSFRKSEEDYYTAQVFREASRWLWENQDAEHFFLVVDSFDPHEPWDPPVHYRRLYDADEDVVDVIHSPYGPWKGELTWREVRRLQANYAGEVTMVDRWLGHFIEVLRLARRLEDTVIGVISDHGHNLGIDPGDKGLVSKQGHPMTHAVADLVMMIRHPEGVGARTRCDALCYNYDLISTLLPLIGVEPTKQMDGIDLWPLVTSGTPAREHVTIAWGPIVTVITDGWWYNADIWGKAPLLYPVRQDPNLEHNMAQQHSDLCEQLRLLAVQDAGGQIPEEFAQYTGRPGCTPFLEVK
jgi:arylsulfatase A-like enzyme